MQKTINKIFIIGLQQTGLTSICLALKMLGFSVTQFFIDEEELLCNESKEIFYKLINNNYNLPIIHKYDAIADLPVPAFYQQFDYFFPKSKFILTIREKKDWLISIERQFQYEKKIFTNFLNKPFKDKSLKNFSEYYHMHYLNFVDLCVYGSVFFNKHRFSAVYDAHTNSVNDYFKNRPQDLLVIDISKDNAWEKICFFLGKELIKENFPWVNSWEDRTRMKDKKINTTWLNKWENKIKNEKLKKIKLI